MNKLCTPHDGSVAGRLLHILGVQAAAVDLAQREAGAQPKQLAAPAPRGVRDVARGGARVPPERHVVLGLAREAERALERGEHRLIRVRLGLGVRVRVKVSTIITTTTTYVLAWCVCSSKKTPLPARVASL